MSDIVIRVEGIGKKYQIGKKKSGEFRESFGNLIQLFKSKASSQQPVANNTFWALKDISFEVKQGEAVGIIGRNGAGKSTLLKVLSRITKPTTGRFEINGRVSSLLEVGTGFHPELTGRENIYLNGTILGMRRAEIKAKFDEIIGFSGVEEFIDTPVKHYSSGMKVRLAFSVAAHLEPEILIIDEVLAVGDAEFQKKCLGKMEDVTGEGRTVLFVSHNMGAVKSFCGRSILIQDGKIEQIGETYQIINKYQESAAYSNINCLWEKYNNDSLQLLNISLYDTEGQQIDGVSAGTPWLLRIEMNLKKPVSHFIAALGIMTVEDTPVRTLYSRPGFLEVGNYEMEFKVDDVFLASGLYKLVVGLSSHEQPLIAIRDHSFIEIQDAADKSKYTRSSSKNGLIINHGNVVINKK